MKILMTTMKLDIGGAETHIVELCGELKRRGHEIVVASNGGVYVKTLEAQGIRHIKLRCITNVFISFALIFGLKRLIRSENFDVSRARTHTGVYMRQTAQVFGVQVYNQRALGI